MSAHSAWRAWTVLAVCTMLAAPTAVAPNSVVAGPAYLAGLTGVVGALWVGALRQGPHGRLPWRLLALAASCWLAGDILQFVGEALGHDGDVAGPPDVLWLASYPLLGAAVVKMVNARGLTTAIARRIRLDVVVASLGATVVAWHVLIAPGLRERGRPFVDVLLGTLYPLGDVMLVAFALVLVMAPGRRGVSEGLLIACFGFTLPFDLLMTALPRVAPGFNHGRLDAGLLVANALLAVAALHPSSVDTTRSLVAVSGHEMRRWRVVLLGASLCGVTLASSLSEHDALIWYPTTIAALATSATIVVRFYLAILEQAAAEAALAHQATHDQLTGAANRSLLVRRLEAAVDGGLDASDGAHLGLTLVFIDLDGFKAVNDVHGHPAGDAVLRAVADRLATLVRATDTVARVGGDEFVLLCNDVPAGDADALGARVVEAVRRPIDVGHALVTVGASVGLLRFGGRAARTIAPDDHSAPAASTADALLRTVDSAMYEAKRLGGGVRTAYTPA